MRLRVNRQDLLEGRFAPRCALTGATSGVEPTPVVLTHRPRWTVALWVLPAMGLFALYQPFRAGLPELPRLLLDGCVGAAILGLDALLERLVAKRVEAIVPLTVEARRRWTRAARLVRWTRPVLLIGYLLVLLDRGAFEHLVTSAQLQALLWGGGGLGGLIALVALQDFEASRSITVRAVRGDEVELEVPAAPGLKPLAPASPGA